MSLSFRSHTARLTLLALAASLAACSTLDGPSDSLDYRTNAPKAKPLDVPPDLSQLARDARYQPQSGVVSASAGNAPAARAGVSAAAAGSVAPVTLGNLRVERDGQQRWLVVPVPPEQLWPQLKAFWEQRGFTLEVDDARLGVLETNWAENRAKLPPEAVRNTIGRLLRSAYDSGERDRFRTRVERTATGSEIYVAHRGIEEVFTEAARDATAWRARPSDPQLEAEMLSRLMVALAGNPAMPAPAGEVAAARTQIDAAAAAPARARLLSDGAGIEMDDSFDRGWRRVGLALDRGGFTVEDRDRSLGIYYVRYVDPRAGGKDEPGFWARLMGDTTNVAPQRYRIIVKAVGSKSVVAVLNSDGGADVGENGKRIITRLSQELR